MISLIRERFADKSVLLLGFGREGQSTYKLLRKIFPAKPLAIADQNDGIRDNPLVRQDSNLNFVTGSDYLENLGDYDVIIRSPGIAVWQLLKSPGNYEDQRENKRINNLLSRNQITSQTELFLEFYSKQVIGITGTKGKSTTSSLIHHILKTAGRDALLVGNIGNPVFHFIDLIHPETIIVFELSSHQLEFLKRAPHIAVLLNLFQEHLDAYVSYEAYQLAKINLAKFQQPGDYLIFNSDDPKVRMLVEPYLKDRRGYPFSLLEKPCPGGYTDDGFVCFTDGEKETRVWKIHQDRFLRGEHNLKNIMAAANVAMICGIHTDMIEDGISTFKGLEHRLEYLGVYAGIHFYNDSIATIPEACMEAVRAVPDVDTLIVGGFDRGIDYSPLAEFLSRSQVRNLIMVGAAGKRIMEYLVLISHANKKIFYINRFDDFKAIAFRETRPGHACLLSPAAASYDEFKNFEERGKRFRELVSSEVAR